MTDIPYIAGAGGRRRNGRNSSSQQTDTLQSSSTAKILDAICEGEIFGLVNADQSIYLDGTPIKNADGSYNFPIQDDDGNYTASAIKYEFRTGTQTQEYIPGIADGVENNISVSQEVKVSTGAVTKTITSADTDAVKVLIILPALQEYKSDGSIKGTKVQFKIYIKSNNGSFVEKINETISGKSSGRFEKEYYLHLEGSAPWQIKVERITADSTNSNLQNSITWDSYSEVVETKFSYPNTVLCGITFDAKRFSSIPTRSYDIKGLLIKFPSNATVRADGSLNYSGIWDGSFQIGWCACPGWCLYDLLSDSRYGASIAESLLDKWAFYEISQYCNVLIDNGFGGTEPRFSLNAYIQEKQEAYNLINSLTSVFRGMAYWAEGGITVVQDALADPVRLFTSANVDLFVYSGSSKRSRHTIAFVAWNDPADEYRQTIEVVEDPEGIALYGPQITEITAFGCTSRGQAHRVGKWLLFSERVETETVTFATGTEGIPLRPGEVIKIGDTKRAGRRWWGRIKVATTTTIELDSSVTLSSGIYSLTVVLPNGSLEERVITSSPGSVTTLSVNPAYSTAPQAEASWMLSSSELNERLYRVVAITETEPHKYEVTALVHNPGKYAEIEQGIKLEPANPGVTPSFPPNPPRNPVSSSFTSVDSNGNYILNLQFSWNYPLLLNGTKDPFTTAYLVQYKNGDESAWVSQTVATQNIDISNVNGGEYFLRVAAIDTLENTSLFVEAPGAISNSNLVLSFNTSIHSIAMSGVL